MRRSRILNGLVLLSLTAVLSLGGTSVYADDAKELNVLEDNSHKILWNWLLQKSDQQYAERQQEMEACLASPEKLEGRRQRLRAAYRELIGQLPEKTPLNARVVGTIERDGYRIERVVYESRPQHRVTACLYIPTEGEGPWPGVLLACGHSKNGKAYEMYQAGAALLAKNGLVALCYDPISQGERLQLLNSRRHGTSGHTLLNVGALLVGRSVVGYEAWDGVRSIDYLLTRPEVDKRKPVGMTGTSGGGTQTTFLMALDDRIGPAAPSCYIMTRQRKFDTLGPADGCQHLPYEGREGIDHADYVLMHAPQPTVILAATRDFFDIRATRAAAAESQRMYETLGVGEGFEFFESDQEHGLRQRHREKATQWMRRWLCGNAEPVQEGRFTHLPDEEVQCTRTGQVMREFSDERSVADLNLQRARALAGGREKFWAEQSRDACLAEVRRLIGCREKLGAVDVRSVGSLARDGYRIEKLVLQRGREVPVPALLYVPMGVEGKLPATLYVDGRGKNAADESVRQLLAEPRVVLSIDARCFGETADRGSGGKYFNKEHRAVVLAHHIGRPLLGQRVEDVLAAIDVLVDRPEVDPTRADAVGVGRAGPVVLHAAALDERLGSVALRDSIRTWIDDVVARPATHDLMGYVVPGALKKYDLPDLVRAIEPRAAGYSE